MEVQEFISEFAIETLDVGVLHGLSRLDESQTHAGPLGPVEHCLSGTFWAVVEDDLLGQPEPQDQVIKESRNPCIWDRHIDDLAEAEPAMVVDDVQRHFDTAKTAGAEIVYPPEKTEWGTWRYRAKDPEGHEWSFGSYAPSTQPPNWS